jgi:hypothetical protein
MICEATGIINFDSERRFKLESPVKFTTPSGINVVMSTKDNVLNVQMTLEVENRDDAKGRASVELNNICNIISYFYDIPILVSRITGVILTEITPEGENIITGDVGIGLDVILSLDINIGVEGAKVLVDYIEKKYSTDFENVIFMWREAISNESTTMKYILLYRLIEFLFENNTKELTKWIILKEPEVQIVKDRKRRNVPVTIYTHLRDNMHFKQKIFPVEDIRSYLPKLQNLVKEAIKMKFSDVAYA